MKVQKSDHTQLLILVREFHCLLNTAWPKPSNPGMSGASVFLGTNLFKALADGVCQIRCVIDGFQGRDYYEELADFWTVFSGLFLKVELQDRSERSQRIDQSLNLLYLASGVFYHRIAEMSFTVPVFDNRLIGVEELDRLLELCGYDIPANTVKSALNGLVQRMRDASNQLD